MNDISIEKIVLDIKGTKIELTLEEVEILKKVLNEVSKDKPNVTITSSWPTDGTTWIYPKYNKPVSIPYVGDNPNDHGTITISSVMYSSNQN